MQQLVNLYFKFEIQASNSRKRTKIDCGKIKGFASLFALALKHMSRLASKDPVKADVRQTNKQVRRNVHVYYLSLILLSSKVPLK